MEIKGSANLGGTSTASCFQLHISKVSGAFTTATTGTVMQRSERSADKPSGLVFTASKNWTGATSGSGQHTHTITLDNALLNKSSTVQPPSIKIRVKTRFK